MIYCQIPCRWLNSDQTTLETCGIEVKTFETPEKIVTFFHIDCVYPFIDSSDGVERTAIRSGGNEYCTDWSVDKIFEEMIKF